MSVESEINSIVDVEIFVIFEYSIPEAFRYLFQIIPKTAKYEVFSQKNVGWV